MNTDSLYLVLKLIAAALLPGVLGWERERAAKPAGLRTHAIVGVASALYAMLGDGALAAHAGMGEAVRTDPVRTIQAVATGIGFLGAGIIFREGRRVEGLTTAASIWAAAAVGLAVAWAQWLVAILATVFIFLILRWPFPSDRTSA